MKKSNILHIKTLNFLSQITFDIRKTRKEQNQVLYHRTAPTMKSISVICVHMKSGKAGTKINNQLQFQYQYTSMQ